MVADLGDPKGLDRVTAEFSADAPYDLVVCFFALQYVAASPEAVARLFAHVNRLATADARCVIALPAADRILALSRSTAEAPLARARMIDPPDTWGATYQFDLVGAIDNCPEYLVDVDALVGVLAGLGWHVEMRLPLPEARGLNLGLARQMGAVAELSSAEEEVVGLYTVLVLGRRPLDADQRAEDDDDQ